MHSDNPTINSAFTNHQSSFIQKNRAVDWILSKSLPDVDQVKAMSYKKLRKTYEQPKAAPMETSTTQPNEYWDDAMTTDKQHSITRLFFQNVRGLQLSRRYSKDKWLQLLEYTKEHKINVVGVAETCTSTSKNRTKHLLQRTSNSAFIQANLCWSNSNFITEQIIALGGRY